MDRRRRLTLMTSGFEYGPPGTNSYFDVSFLAEESKRRLESSELAVRRVHREEVRA